MLSIFLFNNYEWLKEDMVQVARIETFSAEDDITPI